MAIRCRNKPGYDSRGVVLPPCAGKRGITTPRSPGAWVPTATHPSDVKCSLSVVSPIPHIFCRVSAVDEKFSDGLVEPGVFLKEVVEIFPGRAIRKFFHFFRKISTNVFPAAEQTMQTRDSLFLNPGTVYPRLRSDGQQDRVHYRHTNILTTNERIYHLLLISN